MCYTYIYSIPLALFAAATTDKQANVTHGKAQFTLGVRLMNITPRNLHAHTRRRDLIICVCIEYSCVARGKHCYIAQSFWLFNFSRIPIATFTIITKEKNIKKFFFELKKKCIL